MRILIVGAGIGGLSCGIALRQAGFDIEIAEKASTLEEIGAGISLWPNALAALGEIGLEDSATAIGCEMPVASFRRPSGAHLRLIDPGDAQRILGALPVIMHRGELHGLLLDAARGIPIDLGRRCEGVTVTPAGAHVRFEDGTTRTVDLVIGADGLRSAVRGAVAPGPPRYVGLASWRAVIRGHPVGGAWLSVGHGKQFLAVNLSGGRTYLAGVVALPEGAIHGIEAMTPFVRDAFRGWHDPIPALIDATPEDTYIRGDHFDRPAPSRLSWDDRIVLIGDAAHPVTPDLGQGGCLAIEDAVVLARCLSLGPSVADGLRRFERARLRRLRTVVSQSHWMGWILGSPNPVVAATRDAGLRYTPARIRLRVLAQVASRDAFLSHLPARR